MFAMAPAGAIWHQSGVAEARIIREPRGLRWFRAGLPLAIIGLGAFGASRLNLDVDLLELLPAGMPGVAGTAALQDVFERPEQLVVTLRAEGGADLEAAADSLGEALAADRGLAGRVRWRPAWEAQPEPFVDLVAYAWWNASAAEVAGLAGRLADGRLEAGIAARVERLATALDPLETALLANDLLGLTDALLGGMDPQAFDGLAGGGFANAAGSLRVMLVDAPEVPGDYRAAGAWLGRVRAAVGRWQAAEPEAAGVRVRFTGQPAFAAEIGSGMERDMMQSVSGITLIVGLLFWLLHRRLRPLWLLMAAMLGSGLLTLGLAGVLFGSLNVMSMGFATILMGMIEDFGVLGLNEAMERPGQPFAAVHRRIAAPVWWSAVTSAAVFAMLGLSSLPGIAQLGVLTATGILVGAAVMVYGFVPLAMRRPCGVPPDRVLGRLGARPGLVRWVAVGVAVGGGAVLAGRGLPAVVTDSSVLRPRDCEAFEALDEYQREMLPDHGGVTWIPVVARGGGPEELAAALRAAEGVLAGVRGQGVAGHYLPLALVPDPERQRANAPRLAALAAERGRVFRAADRAGVTAQGLELAAAVFARWHEWGRQPGATRRPDPQAMDDIAGRQLHVGGGAWTACGYLRVDDAAAAAPVLDRLEGLAGVDLAGWDYLGAQLAGLLGGEARRLLAPAGAVLAVLWLLVFRGRRERLVAAASLGFAGLVLVAAMSALGIGWNCVNIGAIPLCLGLGLDFHIHMIHALRHAAAGGAATRAVSRALAYCGLSTGLAFGALSMSANAGLASFGTCAMIGVLAALFSAAFLVPAIWGLGPNGVRRGRRVRTRGPCRRRWRGGSGSRPRG